VAVVPLPVDASSMLVTPCGMVPNGPCQPVTPQLLACIAPEGAGAAAAWLPGGRVSHHIRPTTSSLVRPLVDGCTLCMPNPGTSASPPHITPANVPSVWTRCTGVLPLPPKGNTSLLSPTQCLPPQASAQKPHFAPLSSPSLPLHLAPARPLPLCLTLRYSSPTTAAYIAWPWIITVVHVGTPSPAGAAGDQATPCGTARC
jgi:hypothetical protein